MQAWQTTLLSTGLSILTAIITAKVTSWISHRNEVKKWLLEKRAELYFSFYDQIENVLRNPVLIFEREYFDFLICIKPQIKLLASPKTFEAFKNYYEFVRSQAHSFKRFCDVNDPQNDLTRFETYMDENGEEFEVIHIDEEDIKQFEKLQEQYRQEQKPNGYEINTYIENLYQSMREDLGSNI